MEAENKMYNKLTQGERAEKRGFVLSCYSEEQRIFCIWILTQLNRMDTNIKVPTALLTVKFWSCS